VLLHVEVVIALESLQLLVRSLLLLHDVELLITAERGDVATLDLLVVGVELITEATIVGELVCLLRL